MSLGCTKWLDGLTSPSTVRGGLVACLALADSSIQTVTWDTRVEERLV